MRKINAPLSQLKKFAGKWVVIDPRAEKVIAVGDTIKDISALVVHSADSKLLPVGQSPYSYLVPRKDEGPYVLVCLLAQHR